MGCYAVVVLGDGTGYDHSFDCKAFFEGRQGHPCSIAHHCITFDDLVANFYSTGCSEAGCSSAIG